MIYLIPTRVQEVASGLLASSAQPPRATPSVAHRLSLQPAPPPTRLPSFLVNPGALLEGLRCFTAFRPLPCQNSFLRKILKPLVV